MGHLRIEAATGKILHAAEQPFTIPPAATETDVELAGSATAFVQSVLGGDNPSYWRFDTGTGSATRDFPPPAVPNPRAFRRVLLGLLDGADYAAKLARAQDIRETDPGITEPFLRALDGPTLSADETAIVKAIWARMKARAGTQREVLNAGEMARVESVAPNYQIALA